MHIHYPQQSVQQRFETEREAGWSKQKIGTAIMKISGKPQQAAASTMTLFVLGMIWIKSAVGLHLEVVEDQDPGPVPGVKPIRVQVGMAVMLVVVDVAEVLVVLPTGLCLEVEVPGGTEAEVTRKVNLVVGVLIRVHPPTLGKKIP
jgi:hypothetical protein